jgi:primosomal protein N' (replication factor Y)
LEQVGAGTQRIELLFRELFPTARVERADSDTMKGRRHYQTLVERFAARQVDVLIGTQMIAKGLDFPMVSFVGVVEGGTAGFSADFRAHERVFQLIAQVAGRAGRAETPGRVVVQTLTPEMPALRFALHHDYEAFAASELPLRERMGLPPFRRLARIVVAHERDETARKHTEELGGRVKTAIAFLGLTAVDLLGPATCMIPRLRGRYRYELLIRSAGVTALRALLRHLAESDGLRLGKTGVVLDVDPISFT